MCGDWWLKNISYADLSRWHHLNPFKAISSDNSVNNNNNVNGVNTELLNAVNAAIIIHHVLNVSSQVHFGMLLCCCYHTHARRINKAHGIEINATFCLLQFFDFDTFWSPFLTYTPRNMSPFFCTFSDT